MTFEGIQKFTLLDYPGLTACTLFSPSCNFRCPFCHNGEIVSLPVDSGAISEDEVLSFLKKRIGLLQGVCFSGGEVTLQKGLIEFITKVKELGFKVKLDTNGYNLPVLKEIIEKKCVDYIAMDVKSSFSSYALCSGVPNIDTSKIQKAIELIKESDIDYEFRTTLVRELNRDSDILSLAEYMKDVKLWRLQEFRRSEGCIKKNLSSISSHYVKSLLNKYKEHKNFIFY